MKPRECEFEAEALAAAVESRWPGSVDAELRAHVEACPVCRDIVAVVSAVGADRERLRAAAPVPDPGRVWRMAQLRARSEAARAAGRPITVAQVMALAGAMGLLGACFGATSTWFQTALGGLSRQMAGLKLQSLIPSAWALATEHGLLLLCGAALLLLAPAAVCVAILRE